ncbi:A1S_2505 family phage non-structural protein [Rhizobium rhizogenes]|uniref:A1S_2505 family phage non-structural protein n=1 Tax=Rhizobium rhizogenes TaxID=359 RepID=UPI000556DCDA|nr:hypothetical protein [Rhizobium rhizogenes]NTJ22193.1 hypothetical protein [Rhizobium rhizogenes]QUE80912.1 hypothetical protein EML492_03635 [Rhizobium rhizogenes]TQO80981.1 hypothetical protein FFE80_07765 [Rhizobium rhizogenes]TRB51575.1 hypothetical protein EXN69_26650 [Rhizobium rhizogenes]
MTDIFVFGSNLAGIHGAGAARFAVLHHGAIYGQGIGLQGNSYGIPTKNERIETLPLAVVERHVETFKDFARTRPDLTFYVTPIGCGLAGYKRPQIRPMFDGMPPNCRFAETWEDDDL